MKNFNFLNNAMQPLTVESFSFKFRSNFDFESRIRPRSVWRYRGFTVFIIQSEITAGDLRFLSRKQNLLCQLIFSLHSPIFYLFIYFLKMFIKICCRFINTESKREWGVTSASSSDGDVYSHGGSFI